jgi:hypothetical protein
MKREGRSHLTPGEIAEYVVLGLTPESEVRLEAHLAGCAKCGRSLGSFCDEWADAPASGWSQEREQALRARLLDRLHAAAASPGRPFPPS